jgi:signal transduction histidine kinase
MIVPRIPTNKPWSAEEMSSRRGAENGVHSRAKHWGGQMARIRNAELISRLGIATEALQKAEERATAGQLALEVMHEVQNPLQALEHITFLAIHEAENPRKLRDYLHLAEEQLATLGSITRQTLGFARASDSPKPVDLSVLAEAAIRIHQRAIEAKSIHLVKDLPGDLVAEVYTGELLQVISNLIVNALDAMPPSGTLCLRLRKRRGEVRLVIADNGHGIPEEHAYDIFQPFFTTKQERGSGLGLAISKKIVERHRGKITMRSSVRPGKSGTMFTISLPA